VKTLTQSGDRHSRRQSPHLRLSVQCWYSVETIEWTQFYHRVCPSTSFSPIKRHFNISRARLSTSTGGVKYSHGVGTILRFPTKIAARGFRIKTFLYPYAHTVWPMRILTRDLHFAVAKLLVVWHSDVLETYCGWSNSAETATRGRSKWTRGAPYRNGAFIFQAASRAAADLEIMKSGAGGKLILLQYNGDRVRSIVLETEKNVEIAFLLLLS